MPRKATDTIGIQKNKTRTHIWYEVETNGAIEVKDIPFDIGVMSDLSGDNQNKRDLRDREFIEVSNPAKFDDLVRSIKPKLELELEFGEGDDKSVQKVDLDFGKLADFGPEEILAKLAKQVGSVSELVELRDALYKTRETVNVSRDFEAKLKEMLSNPEKLAQLKGELDKQ